MEGIPQEVATSLVPLSVLIIPGLKPIVLCQDAELVSALEFHEKLASQLQAGRAEHQGLHVMVRSQTGYQPDRTIYDCLAFRARK